MKIMQINTWQGRLLKPLLNLIKAENPDIIFAQEVYDYPASLSLNSPWNYFDTARHIAAQGNYPATYFSPELTVPMFEAPLGYGNAIFSKTPFTHSSVHYTAGPGPLKLAGSESFSGNLGRNFQHAVINAPNGPLNLINHHGHWVNQPLGDQTSHDRLQDVANYLTTLTGPIIFAGDLNLSPDSPALRSLITTTNLSDLAIKSGITTTLSSAHHVTHDIICDYILASPSLTSTQFEASSHLVSDHRALIAQIDA